MPKIILNFTKVCSIFILLIFSHLINSDSFKYNFYNNHGSVGLINMPSARMHNEAVHGVTIYNGFVDQKITATSNPFDWLEASFFYMNIPDNVLCRRGLDGKIFCQGYKDKGFNLKVKLKDEGILPAISMGINDIAGTGYYGSEYVVASYGLNKLDLHFGLGWGNYNGSENELQNPLKYLSSRFESRSNASPTDQGGTFNAGRYFSGKSVSPFYGLSYSVNEKIILKFEKDTTLTPGKIEHDIAKSDYSFGVSYSINETLNLGISSERGNGISFNFQYKKDPNSSFKKSQYKYKKSDDNVEADKYDKLIANLENNGIGVSKIRESASSIGLELTQFVHPNLQVIENIVQQAAKDANIKKDIKKDIKIASLKTTEEINKDFVDNSVLIYERAQKSFFNTNTGIKFRPFIASREAFLKGALLVENDSEFVFTENLIFTSNLKYAVSENFDDLTIPPQNTFPAQVRSDVKEYLRNIDNGILIGRAQLDFYYSYDKNNHFMISGGILEDMFSGAGIEYLFHKQDTNYSFGIELFKVKKRDYEWRFGHFDYENTILNANFYYRNYGLIPFDMKISAGEYLAGDVGSTIELSRSYVNGVRFGVFATFTDVTFDEFGEGSFDKGIFFNIPIYGNLINYSWRPFTKDPGAKLVRKNELHNLLVKFRPIN